ncbi:MAG TPA: Ig-like domain-containing protein, partial [Thermoanaerobaculia bacterium]|nr:Ig-like domain-containing protein [Thermoanaerobaculia bacterium]
MTRPRGFFAALIFGLLFVLPGVAQAANSEFRVLLDVDHDAASGCTISGMPGVDQVFTTRVTATDTDASVTRTVRQVCTTAGFGPIIDVETSGWPAGFQPASGGVTIETRIPFSAFGSTTMPSDMRVGIEAVQGTAIHTAIVRPDGTAVVYPGPRPGKRRSVGAPGAPRVIVLDGLDNDWTGLSPLFTGIAAGGSPSLRLLKVTAFTDNANDQLYFLFHANLSNDAPFATDDEFPRTAGEALAIPAPGVLANDGDPSGLPLTALPVSPATRGSVTLNPDGSFTYTPDNPASTEDDTFEYKASNGTKDSNTAIVTITVSSGTNSSPVATNDAFSSNEDEPLNVPAPGVLQNDTDADPITASLLAPPANGAVVLNANGGFTYTPNANFFGTDTFTYTVSDGTNSDTATVTITIASVNDFPSVDDDTFSVVENSSAGTTVGTPDVDDQDTGDSHTFSITAGNTGGAFAINEDTGVITVATPSAVDFETTPQFILTVRAQDDGVPSRSGTGTITINVTNANDAPVAVADSGYTVAEGGTLNGISVLANDTDPEGASLTAVLVSGPANASSFTLNANGTFAYTHNGGETTTDSFTYRANDGALNSNTVTVTIAITAVNDAPVAAPDGYTVAEGGTLNETAGTGVLANDADVDSSITAVLVSGPANASSFTLNADGSFTYTHNGSETTSDSFTYKANDGTLDSSTVTVTITINAANDAPVAVADGGYAVNEGGTITGAATVLGNDTDAEGNTLTAVLVSGPANASSFTLHADGTFDYTHNGGETTGDSFTYRANDGSLNSNTVTVTIAVNPINDAPVAVADSGYTVAEGGTITGGATVRGNDTDAEGSTLNAILVSGPANASSFTLNADGTFNYTHNGSETTSDSFTYKANDGTLDSNTVTVSITITAVNDAPVAVADSGYSVAE